MTFCPLADQVRRTPNAMAVVDNERSLSYEDLHRSVQKAAAALSSRQVEPGQPVAILSENSLDYITLLFALGRLGTVACPLSVRLPLHEIERQLENLACNTLICSNAMLSDGFPERSEVWATTELLSRDGRVDFDVRGRPEPATVLHTSGSSAEPKAVRHGWSAHRASAVGSNRNIVPGEGDRWLLSLPLYHVGGLAILFRCFEAGATVALPSRPGALDQGLAELKPTHLSLVPVQLKRLLDSGAIDNQKGLFKAILTGGSAVPADLVDRALDRGLPVFTSYGSTEMASQVTATRPGATRDELMTSGCVLAGRELRIADDGEICVRGDTLCDGIIVNGRLVDVRDEHGWYATGDLGEVDAEGRLIVTGRKDRMFVSGGENIQPEQIERVILELGDVLEVAVWPVDHPEFGRRPVAVVQLKPDSDLSAAGLADYLAGRIERFKIPDIVYRWPETADSSEMKPDRRSLEDMYRRDLLIRLT